MRRKSVDLSVLSARKKLMVAEPTPKKKTILLVEDNAVDVFINTMVLRHVGVVEGISVAPNGKHALDMLKSICPETGCLPDVVFVDLHMPVMDGFAFLEALNEMKFRNKEKMLTVVVSCSNWPLDKERVHALGIKDYLLKPVTADDIRRVFEENGIEVDS